MLGNDGAQFSLLALMAYGATVLAFLGGVHWGFALDEGSNQTSQALRARLVLGVVPSLIGWAAAARGVTVVVVAGEAASQRLVGVASPSSHRALSRDEDG